MAQFLVTCLVAFIASIGAAAAQTLVDRGSYLVNAVMACDGCHTPREKSGFVMERRFSGGSQTWDTPAYTVKGSNITPDRETGIGAWSDDEIRRSLTEGVRRSGGPQNCRTSRPLSLVWIHFRREPPHQTRQVPRVPQPPHLRAADQRRVTR